MNRKWKLILKKEMLMLLSGWSNNFHIKRSCLVKGKHLGCRFNPRHWSGGKPMCVCLSAPAPSLPLPKYQWRKCPPGEDSQNKNKPRGSWGQGQKSGSQQGTWPTRGVLLNKGGQDQVMGKRQIWHLWHTQKERKHSVFVPLEQNLGKYMILSLLLVSLPVTVSPASGLRLLLRTLLQVLCEVFFVFEKNIDLLFYLFVGWFFFLFFFF